LSARDVLVSTLNPMHEKSFSDRISQSSDLQ